MLLHIVKSSCCSTNVICYFSTRTQLFIFNISITKTKKMSAKLIYLEKPFVLKGYSKKELRNLLEVSEYVLKKWLAALQPQLGEPTAGIYSVSQVKLIIEKYGV